ncbi:MAG: purine-nucleoside phosphorylase [bacterium]|nr:purine-nucleoside phosphorylase [bacterium]
MTTIDQDNMDAYRQQVEECAAYLAKRLSAPLDLAIQLGTGLGDLAAAMDQPSIFPYTELPHFPKTTVTSHSGNLIVGRLAGKQTAILQGRFHWYEGYSARRVGFPIRVLSRLGAKVALITNASGGLNPSYRPGSIMVVADHLNLLPDNPLRGPNVEAWGERFPDCSQPYDKHLRHLLMESAAALCFTEVTSGTYVCVPGPSLETPAETRYLRLIGADAVGMSSVPEALTALHAGLRVTALSVVANVNDPDNFTPIRIEDIVAAAQAAQPRLRQLILHFLASLAL